MADVSESSRGATASSKRVGAPPSGRGGGNGRQLPAPTVEVFRRRLAQAEMQLREMEEELARLTGKQNRELEMLGNENKHYRERLEEIRMEECMSPAELEAVRIGTESGATGAADYRLIASSTPKYCMSRELIECKRADCAEAEAKLAGSRQDLLELRRQHQAMKRRQFGSGLLASYAQLTSIDTQKQTTRNQLRTLEMHLERELERFSELLIHAKAMRTEIDSLLITQTRYNKSYRKRHAELLDTRKEMAFLMEVCSLIFEEREQELMELAELKRLAAEESHKYEEAFVELTAVIEENANAQQNNETRMTELQKALQESRRDRIQLEKTNHEHQLEAHQNNGNQKRRSHPSGSRGSHVPESGRLGLFDAGADEEHNLNAPRHNDDVMDDSYDEEDEEEDETGVKGQVRELDKFYDRLAAIVDSDDMSDMVEFLNCSADRRFAHFSDMNRLEEEMAALETERTSLMQEMDALGTETPEQQARSERMRALQKKLDDTKERIEEQNAQLDCTTAILDKVVVEVSKQFRGVGCDVSALREKTGLEGVMRTTATACLQLIEQRVEEYLLSYSCKQQKHHQQMYAGTQDLAYAGVATNSAIPNAARTLLKRPDLLPHGEMSAKSLVRLTALPHTAEPSTQSYSYALTTTPSMSFAHSGGGTEDFSGNGGAEQPLSMIEARAILREKMR